MGYLDRERKAKRSGKVLELIRLENRRETLIRRHAADDISQELEAPLHKQGFVKS